MYTLWDDRQIYQSADMENYETWRPEEDDDLSFRELQAINPEVIGWLTVYGTKIDYPFAQADNNTKYVNTDITGEFALSGSLFLDCQNAADFTDLNHVIYGHHMEKKTMLGEPEDVPSQTVPFPDNTLLFHADRTDISPAHPLSVSRCRSKK